MDKQTSGEPLMTRESIPEMKSPLRRAMDYVDSQGPKPGCETMESLEVVKSLT